MEQNTEKKRDSPVTIAHLAIAVLIVVGSIAGTFGALSSNVNWNKITNDRQDIRLDRMEQLFREAQDRREMNQAMILQQLGEIKASMNNKADKK